MTHRNPTQTPPDSELPLEPDAIDRILRTGVLDVTRNPEAVDDLVQGAWVRLLEQLPRLRDVDPPALGAYIRRLARGAAIDALRAEGAVKRGGRAEITAPANLDLLHSSQPDPEKITLDRERLRHTLQQAAGRGRKTRPVLELLFLRGLSPDAAAERLGISRHTVYSTLNRARARLQSPA